MASGQMGFGGPGYETRAPEREIQPGDIVIRRRIERFVVKTVDRNEEGTLVLVCLSCLDSREAVLLGARPGHAQEWTSHHITGR